MDYKEIKKEKRRIDRYVEFCSMVHEFVTNKLSGSNKDLVNKLHKINKSIMHDKNYLHNFVDADDKPMFPTHHGMNMGAPGPVLYNNPSIPGHTLALSEDGVVEPVVNPLGTASIGMNVKKAKELGQLPGNRLKSFLHSDGIDYDATELVMPGAAVMSPGPGLAVMSPGPGLATGVMSPRPGVAMIAPGQGLGMAPGLAAALPNVIQSTHQMQHPIVYPNAAQLTPFPGTMQVPGTIPAPVHGLLRKGINNDDLIGEGQGRSRKYNIGRF